MLHKMIFVQCSDNLSSSMLQRCMLCVLQEDMTVSEAMSLITCTKQPLLFRLCSKYYVKVDSTPISVEAGCFCDAIEILLKVYYVLDLQYEYELKPTFGFIENILRIPISIGSSKALKDFMRIVAAL